jgi:hypothetical protein
MPVEAGDRWPTKSPIVLRSNPSSVSRWTALCRSVCEPGPGNVDPAEQQEAAATLDTASPLTGRTGTIAREEHVPVIGLRRPLRR